MGRRALSCLLFLSLLVAPVLAAPHKEPPVAASRPADAADKEAEPLAVTDEDINKAIDRGVAYLWSKLNAQGNWGPHGTEYPDGPTALACLALLESGVSTPERKNQRSGVFVTLTSHYWEPY